MKTTLDLPDDLLIEAKTVAARRRTTLKAIVESALRREIRPPPEMDNPDPDRCEVNELGFLVLRRKRGSPVITTRKIRAIRDEIEEQDSQRTLRARSR
ncbi:MAG: hypothetical protein HS122_06970 [Opitutaceae bacterium]|nr:hypothetical protein [Opitutaceae bacterium]